MIEVNELTKAYSNVMAVDGLSFTIEKGKIYGFLGPNGAGKSTTMNIITGCLAPTSGTVKIGGYDIYEESLNAKRLIGYLPEIPPLYAEQTPREYLDFVADAKGIKKAEKKAAIEKVIETTHIEDVADRLIKKLSKGYKQRVGIAQALLGDPEVIILDEPTVGLDPIQIIEIRALIKSLGESHTVILSSHILSEVQAVCDMVLIINKGKLIAFDKTENLESKMGGSYSIELSVEADAAALSTALDGIEGVDAFNVSPEDGGICRAIISCGENDPKPISKEIFERCFSSGISVLSLSPKKASLEDIFIELTESDPAEAAAEAEEADGETEDGLTIDEILGDTKSALEECEEIEAADKAEAEANATITEGEE